MHAAGDRVVGYSHTVSQLLWHVAVINLELPRGLPLRATTTAHLGEAKSLEGHELGHVDAGERRGCDGRNTPSEIRRG